MIELASRQTSDAVNEFDRVPENDSSVIHRHSRSFSLASKMLPTDVRADIQKLYAWCRWCDDAVDTAENSHVAAARLAILREDVRRIYRGHQPHHQASEWIADLVQKYQLDQEHPLGLITGMEMDLSLKQIMTENQLLQYCYHAAGVVGVMMCHVFGVTDPEAVRHAESLGIAMQLTNIARDVREDWQRGRCYLPKSWLPAAESAEPPTDSEVRQAVQRLLALTDLHYEIGNRGMSYLPLRTRGAIRIASAVYREIGQEIRRNDYRVMHGRTIVPKSRFAFVAVCGWCSGGVESFREYLSLHRQSENNLHHQRNLTGIIMNDSKYVFYLGISLTSFMGCALFLLVLLNPKEASYSWLPVVYAVSCLVVGIITNWLAKQAELPATVTVREQNDFLRNSTDAKSN